MARAGSAKGETHIVEWQESWRDDYLRWLCGFANADGGTLVIGRNDKGERLPPKALTLKRAELVERLRLHDHHAKIATADDARSLRKAGSPSNWWWAKRRAIESPMGGL